MKRWPIIAAAVATVVLIARADGLQHSLPLPADAAIAPVAVLCALALAAIVVAGLAYAGAHRARREANRVTALLSGVDPNALAAATAAPAAGRGRPSPRPRPEAQANSEPEAELLLRPIVSQSRNEAAGFDAVFAGGPSDTDPLRRDRARLLAAAEAMALRPGELNAACPVFAPVSAAFLLDPGSSDFLKAMVRGKANVAHGLKLVVAPDSRLAALAAPKRLPLGLALGGVNDALLPHASHFRISAAQLLSPHAARRLPAWQAVEWARGHRLAVIACDVGAEDDTGRLIELGIDLVTGPGRFAPLRLRPIEPDARISPAGTLPGRVRPLRASQ